MLPKSKRRFVGCTGWIQASGQRTMCLIVWMSRLGHQNAIQAVGAVPFYLLLTGRPSTRIEPWLPLPVRWWLTCGPFFCHVTNSPWKLSLFASNSPSSSGSSPGPDWIVSIGCSGLSSAGCGRARSWDEPSQRHESLSERIPCSRHLGWNGNCQFGALKNQKEQHLPLLTEWRGVSLGYRGHH
jgi:hypothetical protein